MLFHEPFQLLIDQINLYEKFNIIESADDLLFIRDLRSQIAHEYIPEALNDLVPEVLRMTEFLSENINAIANIMKSRGWI